MQIEKNELAIVYNLYTEVRIKIAQNQWSQLSLWRFI